MQQNKIVGTEKGGTNSTLGLCVWMAKRYRLGGWNTKIPIPLSRGPHDVDGINGIRVAIDKTSVDIRSRERTFLVSHVQPSDFSGLDDSWGVVGGYANKGTIQAP